MTDRRYSIIPARAVTDPRLEGRDLQVLGFLGTHTDKLGWCFLRQGEIAKAIDCGRSTVQRSLARLIDASWVQTKEFIGTRPHACHAYRVIMDRDDPNIKPPEYAVGGDDGDERYPPVGTSGAEVHHQRAPVPSHERAPPDPEVPTYARAHKDPDSGGDSSGARARGFSDEALKVSDELAVIAGHDLAFLPPRWMSDGPVIRVQMMLDHGWQAQMMLETAKAIMARKTDGPPATIRYFEKPFARAHARQSQQAPLPLVAGDQRHMEATHAQTTRHASDWKGSRDNFRGTLGRLGETLDDAEAAQRSAPSAEIVQLAPAAGRGKS